jgi:hypothetical protein
MKFRAVDHKRNLEIIDERRKELVLRLWRLTGWSKFGPNKKGITSWPRRNNERIFGPRLTN